MKIAGFMRPDGEYFEANPERRAFYPDQYPAGTVEVPRKPGPDYEWNGAEWVATPPAPAVPAVLSPAQFEWLLAFTGLGDLWDGIEAVLKDTDRAAYAAVKMERKRETYIFDVTLVEVAKMRPVAAQIAPDVDISDAAIKAAWTLAEAV